MEKQLMLNEDILKQTAEAVAKYRFSSTRAFAEFVLTQVGNGRIRIEFSTTPCWKKRKE